MTIKDLADHIVKHFGKVPYHYGDDFTVSYHTRTVLKEHMHITEQHIVECCEKASNYEQYIEFCRPLAVFKEFLNASAEVSKVEDQELKMIAAQGVKTELEMA